eukprot:g37095.t1
MLAFLLTMLASRAIGGCADILCIGNSTKICLNPQQSLLVCWVTRPATTDRSRRVHIARGCYALVELYVQPAVPRTGPSGRVEYDKLSLGGLCADALHNTAENVWAVINNTYSNQYGTTNRPNSFMSYQMPETNNDTKGDVVLRHRWSRPCSNWSNVDTYLAIDLVRYNMYEGDCMQIEIGTPFELEKSAVVAPACDCTEGACPHFPVNYSSSQASNGYLVYSGCANAPTTTVAPPTTSNVQLLTTTAALPPATLLPTSTYNGSTVPVESAAVKTLTWSITSSALTMSTARSCVASSRTWCSANDQTLDDARVEQLVTVDFDACQRPFGDATGDRVRLLLNLTDGRSVPVWLKCSGVFYETSIEPIEFLPLTLRLHEHVSCEGDIVNMALAQVARTPVPRAKTVYELVAASFWRSGLNGTSAGARRRLLKIANDPLYATVPEPGAASPLGGVLVNPGSQCTPPPSGGCDERHYHPDFIRQYRQKYLDVTYRDLQYRTSDTQGTRTIAASWHRDGDWSWQNALVEYNRLRLLFEHEHELATKCLVPMLSQSASAHFFSIFGNLECQNNEFWLVAGGSPSAGLATGPSGRSALVCAACDDLDDAGLDEFVAGASVGDAGQAAWHDADAPALFRARPAGRPPPQVGGPPPAATVAACPASWQHTVSTVAWGAACGSCARAPLGPGAVLTLGGPGRYRQAQMTDALLCHARPYLGTGAQLQNVVWKPRGYLAAYTVPNTAICPFRHAREGSVVPHHSNRLRLTLGASEFTVACFHCASQARFRLPEATRYKLYLARPQMLTLCPPDDGNIPKNNNEEAVESKLNEQAVPADVFFCWHIHCVCAGDADCRAQTQEDGRSAAQGFGAITERDWIEPLRQRVTFLLGYINCTLAQPVTPVLDGEPPTQEDWPLLIKTREPNLHESAARVEVA